MKFLKYFYLISFSALVATSELAVGSAQADEGRNDPWECDEHFSQAQYDSDGVAFGLQRFLVDTNDNVFKVYPSSVLAVQPKCVFYESRLGEVSVHSVPPLGIYKFKYIIRNGYLEKEECVNDAECRIKYLKRR
jgi:hypothetical protein